jgi:hypothetical protein
MIDLEIVSAAAFVTRSGSERAALLVAEHDLNAGCGGDVAGAGLRFGWRRLGRLPLLG